jgi:hypothetical protein
VKINKYQANSKTRRKCSHPRTVQLRTTNCSMPHGGHIRCTRELQPTVSSWWHYGGEPPNCLVRHRTVWCMADARQRSDPTASGAPNMASDFPVCRREATSFLQRPYLSWGLYILHPTSHFKVWKTKQHTNTCYRHFHVLKHPSA